MKETDNVAEVFKALSLTDESIVEGKPLLFTTRDEMMKKFKNVKGRQNGSSIFTIFWVQGQNGETLIFLHDSGCSEACILIKAVGTSIPAAEMLKLLEGQSYHNNPVSYSFHWLKVWKII